MSSRRGCRRRAANRVSTAGSVVRRRWERASEDGEHLVDRPGRAHVEHGLFHGRPPRPVQRVDRGVGIRSPMEHDSPGDPDPVPSIDDEIDVRWRDWEEAVDERRGPVRPRRAVDRQLGREGSGAPVIPTRNGEVDAVSNGDPPVSTQAPADRRVGQSCRQALPPRDQSALLARDQKERCLVVGRLRSAERSRLRLPHRTRVTQTGWPPSTLSTGPTGAKSVPGRRLRSFETLARRSGGP